MKPHIIPLSILSLATAVLVFSFILPTDAQTPPTVSFTTSALTVEEGRTALLKLKVNTPVTKVTRVRVQVAGATAKANTDYRNPGTVTVTFFPGGLREKSVGIRTLTDTASEGAESFTARVVTVDGKAPLAPVTLPVTIVDKGTSTTGGTTAGVTPLPRATSTYQGPGTGWTLSGGVIEGTGGERIKPGRLGKGGAGIDTLFVAPESSATALSEPAHPAECAEVNAQLRQKGLSRGGDFNFLPTAFRSTTYQRPVGGQWVNSNEGSGIGAAFGFVQSEVSPRTYYSLRMDLDSERLSTQSSRSLGGIALTIPSFNTHMPPSAYFTISACPGDMGTDVSLQSGSGTFKGKTVGTSGGGCILSRFGGQATWDPSWYGVANAQSAGADALCIVEPGKTYYLNMFPNNWNSTEFGCLPASQRILPNAREGEMSTALCTIGISPGFAVDYNANAGNPDLFDTTRLNMTPEERVNAYRVISAPAPYTFGTPVISTSVALRNRFIQEKQSEPYNLVTNPWGRR